MNNSKEDNTWREQVEKMYSKSLREGSVEKNAFLHVINPNNGYKLKSLNNPFVL